MKKLLIISILLFCSSAFSQWIWQNPLPQGNDLRFTKFFNSQTGNAMGNSTTLIKTTDGGNNWFNLPTDTAFYNINSVYFVDSLNWWATGSDWGIVLKTTNGGLNWILFTNVEYLLYSSSYFINKNTGFVTASGHICKTTNGGLNWDYNFNVSPFFLKSIDFTSVLTGYCSGEYGKILKTTDGGSNWNFLNSLSTKTLFKIKFLNDNTGWALNSDSILISTNGGNNWVSKYPNYRFYQPPNIYYTLTLTSFNFVNSQTGWIAGSYPSWDRYYIIKTTNGGNTWDSVRIKSVVNSIEFINDQTGLSVGLKGDIIKTSNAGSNWNFLNNGIKDQLASVFFINKLTGWIVGGIGKLLKTTNSGLHWDTSTVVSNNYLNCVYFINPNTGWTVGGFSGGSGYMIYKSTNGGNNWNLQLSGGSGGYVLYSCYFIDSLTGFAVGNQVFKTTNGGSNWNQFALANSVNWSVRFLNSQTGFIFGTPGSYKTTNQGNDWIQLNTSADEGVFINSETGWVDARKSIKKTTNGGINWTDQLNTVGLEIFQSINFINLNTGFVTTSYGSIMKTTNGGNNWSMQRITEDFLLDSYFFDSLTGWIVGNNGTILKTTNGGSSVHIINNQNTIPESYSLFQNYPNPFNPSTNIKYQVNKNGIVILKIFDILGREIETLVNEYQKKGTYEVRFSNTELSSGIYFYRIETDDFVQTKKMVLIK